MVLAVLQQRARVQIGRRDVYAATVGGVRLSEPSVDLALAVAISGAVNNLNVPAGVVVIGEVGLAGEVRRVTGIQRRLAEAERLGFRRAIVPPGTGRLPVKGAAGTAGTANAAGSAAAADPPAKPDNRTSLMSVKEVRDVREAITVALAE